MSGDGEIATSGSAAGRQNKMRSSASSSDDETEHLRDQLQHRPVDRL